MADFKLGRLKFVWKGGWEAATDYVKDDIVSYGGNAFVAEEAFTSNANFYVDLDANRWTKIAGGTEWKNEWVSGTYYKVDDLVKYGGNVYRCNAGHTAQQTLEDDVSKWDLYASGLQFRSTWSIGTLYKLNDVVQVGGNVYVASEAHTASALFTTDSDKWDLLIEGTNYRNNFASGQVYQVGDVVKDGGNLYICTISHTSTSSINVNNFQIYLPGQKNAGDWVDTGRIYKGGEVVRFGGRSYICLTEHDVDVEEITIADEIQQVNPGNAPSYWQLVVKGFDWRGVYDNSVYYRLDDVVEYATSSYVCVQAHNYSGTDSITPGTNAAFWQLMSQGDSNAVMTTEGDIAFRDDTDITRLPIGPAGAYLVSDGTQPKWGDLTPQNDYYVSTEGDDLNDGRTPVTAFRTIKRACEETFNLGLARINVTAGTYNEQTPIKIGRGIVLEGNGLGAVTVSPDTTNDNGYGVGVSDDGSTLNANGECFHVNNGSRLRNIVFRGFGTGSVMVSLDPGTGPSDTSVWITSQSPYVQNCTSFTPGGTGMLIDGGLHGGGYKSMVANDWTQINSDGVGIHVRNDARCELVSVFTYYCDIGYLAESGGKIRAIVGNNSYGEYGAVARGFSQSETPKTGQIRLPSATVNAIQSISDDVVVNRSFVDEDKKVYVVGFTNPTIVAGERPAFDPTSSLCYVAQYDTGGNLIFQSTYSGLPGQLTCITQIDTQLYVGGQVRESGTDKGFLMKLTALGDIQWQKTISATSIIKGVTTDGTRLFAVGDHNSFGSTFIRIPAGGGSIDFAKALDFTDSSLNQFDATAIAFAGEPTDSGSTYADAGDSTAEQKIFIALKDTGNNQTYIVRANPTSGAIETSYRYGANLGIHDINIDTGSGDGIYMLASGYYTDVGFTFGPVTLTYGSNINATYVAASSTGSLMTLATASGTLNQFGDVVRNRTVRGQSSGATAKISTYDGVNGSNVEISIKDVEGTFLDGENIELYQAGVDNPFIMRCNMNGDVQWQHSLRNIDGGEYLASFGVGDVVYAAGYQIDDIDTDIRRKGVVVKFSSNGTLEWQKFLNNTSNNTELNGVAVDGVNVVTTGYTGNNDTLYFNIDRNGIGPLVDDISGDFTFGDNSGTENDDTMAEKAIEAIYDQAITVTSTDTTQVLNSSPGFTNTVAATRDGFSGIGRGIIFDVDSLSGEVRSGSVLQIENDPITYFVLDVTEFEAGDSPNTGTANISIDPPIIATTIPNDQTNITIREAFSQVRMTGHDFLDIGTGGFADTNYPVIITGDYAQQPDQSRETLSEQGGRVFYVTTDQDGNFRVGDYFKVEQATGRATLSSEEFDLTGLNELQLGSVRAGKKGATVDEFSTDGTMTDNSDTAVPTEKAVVTYITDQLNAGGATAKLMKDADVDTTIAVDLTDDGATNTIEMSTAGTVRLTINASGQITTNSAYVPTTAYDVATKTYIDTAIGGLSQNSINEGNSDLTMSDTGTGSLTATIDGALIFTATSTGIAMASGKTITGNLTGDVTGNVSGSAGSVTSALTAGTGISYSSGTTYNGSTAITINLTQDIGTSADVRFDSFGVGTNASGTTGEIRATNQITAYYSSDARLKENVVAITNPLEKIAKINGVEYDWTDEYIESKGGEDGYFVRKHDVGLIAQEVEEILPEIVAENSEGYKSIKYERVVALLVEAVKELQSEITQLKGN